MTDKPVELDEHRGHQEQRATEVRRQLHEVHADQEALRDRQMELEHFLGAAPATTWPEAAEKARYLLQLYARTAEAQDPRRKKLIDSVLADFETLTATP
jgi:hypothetical protein